MGRGLIVPALAEDRSIILYEDGDLPSVLAFLRVAEDLKIPDLERDPEVGLTRLVQIIANYQGDKDIVGICGHYTRHKDNLTEGIYMIGNDFQIVDRISEDERKTTKELSPKEFAKHLRVYTKAMRINLKILRSTR